MTAHLLALELGPVVRIIAAARKTRDLWYGSWMLSEIAKAAALATARFCAPESDEEACRLLIVPAPETLPTLEEDEDFLVGDELLLQVSSGVDPRQVAKVSREAAHRKWTNLAEEARRRTRSGDLVEARWQSQTELDLWVSRPDVAGDVVELIAAWVPLTGRYSEDLRALKRLMAGRNRTRNFPPAHGEDAGVPKSSLDGSRESVLSKPEGRKEIRLQRTLRLGRGEQLDALGVTKRVGSGRRSYPSTARIAADPWIRGVSKRQTPEFAALVVECHSLAEQDVVSRIDVDSRKPRAWSHFAAFPFEGAVVYENRHHEFLEEFGEADPRKSTLLHPLREKLRAVIRRGTAPDPYYAVLVADGDNVGAALQRCNSPEDHRAFSSRLSTFAGKVRGIVQEQHYGAHVFAAGEDIVAFVPTDQAIDCAETLRRAFCEELKDLSDPTHPMTLSVGIAIGHFLDALEDIYAAAREMLEQRAKNHPGKNALAVAFHTRGGAPVEFCDSWSHDPAKAVQLWAQLLQNDQLPDKAAYDLRLLAEQYRGWPTATSEDRDMLGRALPADVGRLLSRKSREAAGTLADVVRELKTVDAVLNVANLVILCRQIAHSKALAEGAGS